MAKIELVNIAPLTGSEVLSSILTYAVYGRVGMTDTLVSTSALCSLESDVDADVLSIADCTARAKSSHLYGSAQVPISVTYRNMSTSLDMRVWFPAGISMNTADVNLEKIVSNASCARFQTSTLTAYARFTTGEDLTEADVTDLVSFISDDTTVATVAGNVLSGIKPGSVEVSVLIASTNPSVSVQAPAVHAVVDTKVTIDVLSVVIYTGAIWDDAPGSVALDSSVEPTMQLKSSITAEGDLGYIVVYAEYADGMWEDVTDKVSLRLSDGSGSLAFVDRTTVQVQPGAIAICKPALEAVWDICNTTVAKGIGMVMLDMPAAVAVTIAGKPKIAKSGDGATCSPFDIASSISFVVTVFFEDDTSQAFATDFRTQYTLVSSGASDLDKMDGNVMTVRDGAAIDSDDADVIVQVSIPGYFAVSTQTTIKVVEFTSLVASTTPWPAQDNYVGGVTVLRPFGCSGVYQRLEGRATGTLSDGTSFSSYAFYRQVEFTSSAPDVAKFTATPCYSGICRGLVASANGSIAITGKFTSFTDSKSILVSDDPVEMVSMSIFDDIGTQTTLNGVVGTTDVLALDLTFSDGTTNRIAYSGQLTSGWLLPSSLLNFSSALPSVFSVQSEGILELYNNYYSTVKVTAKCICGTGVNASIDVYANLEPEVYDVDLGNRYGAPFGTTTTGETFAVNVRIEASSTEDLKAYQIVIMFNDSLVQVNNDDDCVQGDGWSSSWECTANDPIDEVLMVGSCASDCGTTGNLDIGTITFQVLASGVNTFTAYITKIKDDVTTVDALYMFAGKDILIISDVGRRLMPHVPHPGALAEDRAPMRLVERRLTDCDGDVPGATNGDCVFDVEDVEYLQFYIVGIVSESDLNAAQLLAMDTDLDGDTDGVDIG